jgi:hypothetical protein
MFDNTNTRPWNNYIMKKYGQSIRRNILMAYIDSFARAEAVKRCRDELKLKSLMGDVKSLEEKV